MQERRHIPEGEEEAVSSPRPVKGSGEREVTPAGLTQEKVGLSSVNDNEEGQHLPGTHGGAAGHDGNCDDLPCGQACQHNTADSGVPASGSGEECGPESCRISLPTFCSCGRTAGSDSTSHSSECLAGSVSCSRHGAHYGQGAHCTEDSSSGQSDKWRDQTHREIMQTVQEMKKRMPSEKSSRRKTSTIGALNYALSCVKQVQANSEYYMLLMRNGLEERRDTAVCTVEELESMTSEHTVKNTDTFVVVFSLATGRILYISEQASSILNCKRKLLDSVKFVELLYHQDVNVFYSHTAQPHLPPWNVGSGSAPVLLECAQVKSFFCRIRGGKDREGEMRYNPFRITPYLLKVQGAAGEEEHPCCLSLAERIISGYEAPRIPMDKRVFTTTHSPGCVFLEVDDRAVPLLGYLPQDLVGTSVLTCLHPEDRTLMLAMHHKIVKYAGQLPFEHSPIRFRCQNGDYATLDTSWSSFINPWSRKVAFIIGRHKVRTGPLNEDVFAAQSKADYPVVYEDVKELQAKIYKLFLQPVHTNGSSGYGSLGSNGSHEHHVSMESSSDSNGNLWEDTSREPGMLQQICANVSKAKTWGSHALKATTGSRTPFPQTMQNVEVRHHLAPSHDEARKQPHVLSYQQINCVDSIIRYLESCTGPALKRKSESLSIVTSSSSSSEEDKAPAVSHDALACSTEGPLVDAAAPHRQVSAGSTAPVVGTPLMDTEAMSVVSVTSQCSYSSTIVHVPQPESEVTALGEDAPTGSEQADAPPAPPRPVPSSTAAPEEFRMVGLTKEVLSAHTQKEEQEYIDRFRHRILQSPYSSYLQQEESSMAPSYHHGDNTTRPVSVAGWNKSKRDKSKHKRPKAQGSSDSYECPPGTLQPSCPHLAAPDCSWPLSELLLPQPSNAGFVPLQPPVMPSQPPCYPMQEGGEMVAPDQLNSTVPGSQQGGVPLFLLPEQNMHSALPGQPNGAVQTAPVITPYMTPIIALVLPNYPTYPGYPMYPQGATPMAPGVALMPQLYNLGTAGSFSFPVTHAPQMGGVVDRSSPAPPLLSPPRPPSSLDDDVDAAQQPALFSSSRSSSPLQLNLLQEEMPKAAEPPGSAGQAESLHDQHAKADDAQSELGNHDAQSTSSEMLDLMLQEDARSGTGSNASGSGSGDSGRSLGSGSGSRSNGTSTSHTGSSNSSKYFASNDSSDTSRKARKTQEAQGQAGFEACVEDLLWTMIQGTPEPVMMTYQIQSRDKAQVLKEDREKLLRLQPLQPWFSQEQKEELAEVHPWIRQHTVPHEINTKGCVICTTTAEEEAPSSPHPNLPAPSCSSETTGQAPDP